MTVITPTVPTYVLRSVAADMTSFHGTFTWPRSGYVFAPDWKANNYCGNGLHGYLQGEGVWGTGEHEADSIWLVVKIESYIDLGGKVKFPDGTVEFCGTLPEASAYIRARGARGKVIGTHIATNTCVDIIAGAYSNIKGERSSAVVVGCNSVVLVGSDSTVYADDFSTVTAGVWSCIVARNYVGIAAGRNSKIRAESSVNIKVDEDSEVTVGIHSEISTREGCVIRAETGSTVKAGRGSTITFMMRRLGTNRLYTGYVGEDLKEYISYTHNGIRFVEVSA